MPRKRRAEIGSLGQIILDYRRSPEFRNLKPNTRELYERAIGHLHRLYDVDVREIKRRHIRKIRDSLQDKPAVANQVVRMASLLLWRAVEDELIDANPITRLPRLKVGQHQPWRADQIDYALEHLSEVHRRALVLALYTGQRQGDVLRMRWSDYDGETIRVTQEKTGAKLLIPVHPELQAHLDAWAAGKKTLTILANRLGQPHNPRPFRVGFASATNRHEKLAGVTFHGLRVTAAVRLAEAGCTTHEIAAITGHKTLQMVAHYSKEAEQETRARAAIDKLRANTTRNAAQVIDLKARD